MVIFTPYHKTIKPWKMMLSVLGFYWEASWEIEFLWLSLYINSIFQYKIKIFGILNLFWWCSNPCKSWDFSVFPKTEWRCFYSQYIIWNLVAHCIEKWTLYISWAIKTQFLSLLLSKTQKLRASFFMVLWTYDVVWKWPHEYIRNLVVHCGIYIGEP